MRYPAEQVDRLAAEYVLGTLHGAARRRFESLMRERADVRAAVWRWERHLDGIGAGVRPHKPAERVWKKIRRRIEAPRARGTRIGALWRGLGVGLPVAAAAAWLAFTLLPTAAVDRMAVVAGQNAQPLWVISADLDRGVLKTEAVAAEAADPGSVYELWALPEGGPPQSLGVLAADGTVAERRLPERALTALQQSQSLAISIEPRGGSPTGLPTGPVVYQASLVTL